MHINALGYTEFRTPRIDEWAEYGTRFLGLQLAERSRDGLVFRMDERSQRIIVTRDDAGESFTFGWEVTRPQDLDELAARLEKVAIPVRRLSAAECQYRHIGEAIGFTDPAGNPLVAFFGADTTSAPFTPGRPVTGFRTGTGGMGHGVVHVKSVEDLMWFYTDVLGFRLTDYVPDPYKVYFFHVNERHHSLAMVESGKTGIHHIMLEMLSLDDVGQGYDIAQADEGRVGVTLGRHTNDFMTSFYLYTPSGFMIEYGWGGKTIDPDTWQPQAIQHGSSFWGHDRTWMSADDLAEMRRIRAGAAAAGLHAPVQVIEGNYQVGAGICPWADALKKQ